MKICLILEGSYPYVNGGVSTWMHNYIKGMPEQEFILWVVGDKAEKKGKFVYEIPENVTEVHEIFLDDALKLKADKDFKASFTDHEVEQLRRLMDCKNPEWETLFSLYQERRIDPMAFLQSDAFLKILTDMCLKDYPYIAFSDAFHTIRSMLLPVLYLLSAEAPEADVYHSTCTGYGGLLACLGGYIHKKPVLLTEHGIYTREREEEIIRARWVQPAFKKRWTDFFYMLSDMIYRRAFRVTSLFGYARKIQIELGTNPDSAYVIANGVNYDAFSKIPLKEDDGFVDIGAVVRLAPIKDIKTMIYAFFELSSRRKNVRLHIMGGTDDEKYAEECFSLVESMGLDNVIFTGRVNVLDYLKKIDFTILTSISEGQPLSVLESFAARRPAVVTDVGCCRALISGEDGDELGEAGYCVPPMYREGLADAMEHMCESRVRREKMGEIGQRRVEAYYQHYMMLENYENLYKEVEEHFGGDRIRTEEAVFG